MRDMPFVETKIRTREGIWICRTNSKQCRRFSLIVNRYFLRARPIEGDSRLALYFAL